MAISQMIGARIHRREDPHLITGGGRFIEDLVRPGTLAMAVVRSPHPHARIKSIDSSRAKAISGGVTPGGCRVRAEGHAPRGPGLRPRKAHSPGRIPKGGERVAFPGRAGRD